MWRVAGRLPGVDTTEAVASAYEGRCARAELAALELISIGEVSLEVPGVVELLSVIARVCILPTVVDYVEETRRCVGCRYEATVY